MCLVLYLAANDRLPAREWPELAAEPRPGAARLPAMTLPHLHFVGAPGSCSCVFPHLLADQPVEWFEGLRPSADARPAEVTALARLFELVREGLQHGDRVELWPAWAGEEGESALGTVELRAATLEPARFVFCERFLHVVRG